MTTKATARPTAKQKMLNKLAEKHALGGPPEGDEFVVADWAETTGLSNSQANKNLGELVSDGHLTMRVGRVGKRTGNIYKPA
jgi:Fic family protein